jgi:hypothetical protein
MNNLKPLDATIKHLRTKEETKEEEEFQGATSVNSERGYGN